MFLPCVCCCCSDAWEYFLAEFKPGFFYFTDGLVLLMKEPVTEEHFVAKAATTSLFVPCVFGTGGNTFKLSALVSWLVRTLAVVLVGLLYLFHFPPNLHTRTTILFCGTNETVANLTRLPGENETCVGWDCFQFCPWGGTCSLAHKLRLCDDGDLTFITNMCWILVLCQVLALFSTYRLNSTHWRISRNSGRPSKKHSAYLPSSTGH